MKKSALQIIFFSLMMFCAAAQSEDVQWISFEAMEEAFDKNPKKVLLFFYADWCEYCKKMDQAAFQDGSLKKVLAADYYAVRMNIESRDTILFDGRKFVNSQYGNQRFPVHELPLLLAANDSEPVVVPVTIIIDEQFRVRKRFITYLDPKKLLSALQTVD